MDTPGTNAIIRHHEELSRGFVPRSDLVIFVTSAERPLTESERGYLELVRDWGKKVLMVVNKADLLEDKAELLPFIDDMAQRYAEYFPLFIQRGIKAQLIDMIAGAPLPRHHPVGQLQYQLAQMQVARAIRRVQSQRAVSLSGGWQGKGQPLFLAPDAAACHDLGGFIVGTQHGWVQGGTEVGTNIQSIAHCVGPRLQWNIRPRRLELHHELVRECIRHGQYVPRHCRRQRVKRHLKLGTPKLPRCRLQ